MFCKTNFTARNIKTKDWSRSKRLKSKLVIDIKLTSNYVALTTVFIGINLLMRQVVNQIVYL